MRANTDGPEFCGSKRERNKGRRGSWTRRRGVCSSCSLTDLWISLLSARGWLRRLTRAASDFWIERERGSGSQKVGRKRTVRGGWRRGRGGLSEGCLNLNLPPVCILWASSKFLRARRNPDGAQTEAHTFIPAVLAPPHIFLPTSGETADILPPPATGNPATRSDRPLHPGV